MTDPTFGISFERISEDPRPPLGADMSVIGLVGTAPDADVTRFPLNTPVLVASDDSTLFTDLGEDGTLYPSIEGINDQLGEFQGTARVVVVRVAREMDGEDEDIWGTIDNLIGDSVTRTGVHALKDAGALLAVIPRLIAVPGYTSQQKTGVGAVNLTNLGSGYTSPPTVGFSGGGGTGATAKATLKKTTLASVTVGTQGTGYTNPTVTAVGGGTGATPAVLEAVVAGGAITGINVLFAGANYIELPTIVIAEAGHVGTAAVATAVLTATTLGGVTVLTPGEGYTSAPTVAFTGGAGSNGAATAVIDLLANPVVAEMPAILANLMGVMVADGPATTRLAFINWRETIQSDRIIPLETAVKVGVDAVVAPGSARILGIAVRRDHEFGGRPFHSWANQPVHGIVGPNRPIEFSLVDGATEGQMILAANGGVIVRGQVGVESAIATGGFIYVGTDTCSEDTLWRFYNVVRGRDYIHLTMLQTVRFYLGRFNLTGQTIESIIGTMKIVLRNLQADGDILGFKVGFARDQNSPEELRLGKFTVDFAAEEAAPLRHLAIRSKRYRPALDALLDDLLAQIDLAA